MQGPVGSGPRAAHRGALSSRERRRGSDSHRRSADRGGRAAGAAVRPRARRARRGPGHDRRRRRARRAHRHPGHQPLRRHLRVADADGGRPRRARSAGRRSAGRRHPLLHLRLDRRAGAGGGVVGRRRGAGSRSSEPDRRRRDRGGDRARGLRVVRRPRRGAGPPRADDRRALPAGRRRHALGRGALRAAARRRADRAADARLAAGDDLRRDRPPLGDAFAQHADARHRALLPGAVSVRGDQPLGGAGDHPPVRARRRAVPRRLRLGGGGRRSAGGAAAAAHVPSDVSQVRRASLRRRAAARDRRARPFVPT